MKKLKKAVYSIQIALDDYDDVFSDFDISPYSRRTLSEDFLREIERRHIEDTKGNLNLYISVPKKERKAKIESIIKRRLKEYYSNKLKEVEEEINEDKKQGIKRIIWGGVLLSLEALATIYHWEDIAFQLLSVIIVPAGWYAMYSGFEYLFDSPKKLKEKKKFYKRMKEAAILFINEEDIVNQKSSRTD